MNRSAATILADIASFHPDCSTRHPPEEWLGLDDLMEELSMLESHQPQAASVLLGVFERFPRHDGYEVFWALLHYLENIPDYETELLDSIRRVPNHMSLVMIKRLINSGVTHIGIDDLAALVSLYEPLIPEVVWHIDVV
jgi:hypothetical protein